MSVVAVGPKENRVLQYLHIFFFSGCVADIEYSLVRTEGNIVTCLFCTKTFSLMSNARRHFREAHLASGRVKPFKCHLCDEAAFTIKRYLNEHLLKKHRIFQSMLTE